MTTKIINAVVVTGFSILKDCGVAISESGRIEEIFNMRRFVKNSDDLIIDVKGAYVCPGLIDTHIHGVGGFGMEDLSSKSVLGMSESLAKFGVTAFLPTVYAQVPEVMFKAEHAVSEAIGKEKGARIMGINLEGPFISPERPGALPAETFSPVNLDYFDRLVEEGKGNVVCMTVAPELKNMRALALRAISRNIVLLAGHTNATYENIIEGMQCGILHSTHFFNAMSRLHHRNPGTVGAILIQNDMTCEIIADGVHVHPELVNMLIKAKSDNDVVLVTDSLKPAGLGEGRFTANGKPVVLSKDGAFVAEDNPDLLNGSAITLNKAVRNVVKWGTTVEKAVKMATENPARIYNFGNIGMLVPGKAADIAVFDSDFNALYTFIGGKLVYKKA